MESNINQNYQDNNFKKNKSIHIYYISIIVLLLLLLSFVTYKYFTVKKQKVYVEVKLKDTNNNKEKLTKDLQNLLLQYESLKTNNKQINSELEGEKEKIKKLLSEIRNIKYANSLEIKKYEAEIETMRNIMRSYIVQIDSLNTRNKILIDENVKVKTDIKKEKNINEDLTVKNNDLTKQVDIASVIKTINIAASPINEKGKVVSKAKKTEKIQVCFTLTENTIAKRGRRYVYIRIARPDEYVINDSENNLFNFEGKDIVYTEKREIDYQGKNVDLCIYWAKTQDLPVGIYNVDIFTDGKQIGTASFSLK